MNWYDRMIAWKGSFFVFLNLNRKKTFRRFYWRYWKSRICYNQLVCINRVASQIFKKKYKSIIVISSSFSKLETVNNKKFSIDVFQTFLLTCADWLWNLRFILGLQISFETGKCFWKSENKSTLKWSLPQSFDQQYHCCPF